MSDDIAPKSPLDGLTWYLDELIENDCIEPRFAVRLRDRIEQVRAALAAAQGENERLRLRLMSAAGDDLCRLTQEEIKAMSSGAVKIPPKEEFLASCERFHAQVAKESGVLEGCLTLAQLVAENERLREQIEKAQGIVRDIDQLELAAWREATGCSTPDEAARLRERIGVLEEGIKEAAEAPGMLWLEQQCKLSVLLSRPEATIGGGGLAVEPKETEGGDV